MKKTTALFTLLLALFLVSGNLKQTSAAEGTTLKPEAVYEYDYESLAVDATADDIFNDQHLMWFNSMISAKIVEVEGGKQLRYTVEDVDGSGFTQFGGFGTGDIGNLQKLEGGKKYHLSLYVNMDEAEEGSVLYIEYQAMDWIGVKVSKGHVEACNPSTVSNLTYVNNVLEFDFIGYAHGSDMNKGWIKLTGQNMYVYDQIYLDDFAISKIVETGASFTQDFENMTVGSAATPTGTNIANVWNADAQSVTIAEADGNKYLSISHTTDAYAWPKFYLNNLPLVSGEEYCLEFDILSHNFDEFYICYPDSGVAERTYNYSPTAFLNGGGDATLGATTFDGTHVTLVFTPSDSFGGFWNQFALIAKQTGTMDLRIDNVKITKTSLMESAAKSIAANISEVTLCVGKELSAEGLEVTLTRNNDQTRVLVADEYVVDASAVNKDLAGEYPLVISIVDEFGKTVSTTVTVKYVAHTEVVDAAVAATCTEKGKTEGKHCSVCNEVLVAQEEVAALGHTEVVDAAVAATCTEKGKTEGKHCSVCNEVLVAQEEVAIVDHADVDADNKCDSCGKVLQEETPTPDPSNPLAGCLGSVGATLFGLFALTGATIFIAKRKREE